MIHLWLPVAHGDFRIFHEGQWHRYDSWDSLAKALRVYGLADSAVCLYIPSINITQIREPMTRQRLRQLGDAGVSYLLEDYVLTSVDDLYVRDVMPTESEVLLSGISKQRVAQYVQSLSLIQLTIAAILPDYLLLDDPDQTHIASVFTDDVTTIVRTSRYEGSSTDDMALLASRLPAITQYHVIGSASDTLAADLSAQNVQVQTLTGGLTPVSQPERHALNFHQKAKRSGLPTYWKAVVSMAAIAVLMMLVYDGLRIWQYQKLARNYQAQTIKQYKQWFPNERPPADIKKTIASKTSASSNESTSLFSLMASVSPLIKQSGLVANRISFQNNRGENNQGMLEISLNASNINDLQTLVNKMTSQGINAQLGNVTPVASNVEGIINVLP